MSIFTRDSGSGRELVPTMAVGDADREEMRGWVQMLRKEAEALRLQATHINTVADDAEALAARVEGLLRAP
jgi:hypothetical protein